MASEHPKQKLPRRSFLTTLWLSSFLGLIGADRFYLGHVRSGAVKLITIGGLGVWTIADIIYTLSGKRTDVEHRKLTGLAANRKLVLVGLPVGIATFLFPLAYDHNLSNTWTATVNKDRNEPEALAIAILICVGFAVGWCAFAGFSIADPIKRKVWIWALVDFISYSFGLGIIFSLYYYLFVRKQLSATTLV